MIPEPSSGGVPSAHVGDETGPVEPVADTEAVETAVSVQFSFADADVAAECECGWRTIGDAAVDAFSAWWKHRATHDYQPRPVASSSTREDGETSTGEDENGHGLACCSCCYAVPAERERAARFEAQLAASQEEARGIAHTLDKAMSELRDARAELEHRRERVTVLRAERDDLRSELAAERAKAERAEALCDEYRTNCDPDTKQAQVAEIFRAAHVGDETGGQHCCPPCAIHTPGEDARSLAALSEWIDAAPANAARDREAATWGRLAKVSEEIGEVREAWLDYLDIANGRLIAAFIGATEQNPRKGHTHEGTDVIKELLDVALTALCAVEHMTGNGGTSMGQFSEHVRSVAARAGLEPNHYADARSEYRVMGFVNGLDYAANLARGAAQPGSLADLKALFADDCEGPGLSIERADGQPGGTE